MAKKSKKQEGFDEGSMPLTPIYSSGTKDMDGKNNQMGVEGPTEGHVPTPDPLGYLD